MRRLHLWLARCLLLWAYSAFGATQLNEKERDDIFMMQHGELLSGQREMQKELDELRTRLDQHEKDQAKQERDFAVLQTEVETMKAIAVWLALGILATLGSVLTFFGKWLVHSRAVTEYIRQALGPVGGDDSSEHPSGSVKLS